MADTHTLAHTNAITRPTHQPPTHFVVEWEACLVDGASARARFQDVDAVGVPISREVIIRSTPGWVIGESVTPPG